MILFFCCAVLNQSRDLIRRQVISSLVVYNEIRSINVKTQRGNFPVLKWGVASAVWKETSWKGIQVSKWTTCFISRYQPLKYFPSFFHRSRNRSSSKKSLPRFPLNFSRAPASLCFTGKAPSLGYKCTHPCLSQVDAHRHITKYSCHWQHHANCSALLLHPLCTASKSHNPCQFSL